MEENQGYFRISFFWLWAGLVMSSAISVSMYVMGQQDARSSIKPTVLIKAPAVDTRNVSIDPEETKCVGQPHGTKQDGWSRLRTQDAEYVQALIKRRMAEYALPRPQTLECRDISKNPITEFYLRETWWRRLPRTQHYQPQACGDYTRPEVPNPKMVAV